ncbi:MAG: DUF1015 domain-containing protein [Armatimonadetes bacterium]|nr:DUF1015 domain-containing protein [Armatimonadota bacterium]
MKSHKLRVSPFAPVVYNPNLGDLSLLIAPPYDVISEEQCRKLLSNHPNNIVRVILPPSLDADDPKRYEKAAALWRDWLARRIVIDLDEPSLFVYLQRFSLSGRVREQISLIAAMPLFDYETNLVRPHEFTMPKPKSDRLELLRATGSEFGQVHGLLSDETSEWNNLLKAIVKETAWLRASLNGVEHIIWRVNDSKFAEEVNRLISNQWLVIADGHHRYETALAFRNEIADAKVNLEHPANFISIVLADYQRNATVLPTHRLLRFVSQEFVERALKEIRHRFWSEEVEWDGSEEKLEQILANHRGIPFVFSAQSKSLLVTIKGIEGSIVQFLEQLPLPLRKVDTAVLHQSLLPVVFSSVGIKPEDLDVDYTHDANFAYGFSKQERCMAVLLRPISLELVRDVAAQGYRLPPKTTYFVPKAPSGLVMRKIIN